MEIVQHEIDGSDGTQSALSPPPLLTQSSPPDWHTLAHCHPTLDRAALTALHVESLQGYLCGFTYKCTAGPAHTADIQAIKDQPYRAIINTATAVMTLRQPIKCLEAVTVALHCTQSLPFLQRVPLRFRSQCGGHTYWHIVLVLVSDDGLIGSVSLSRQPSLYYRPMVAHWSLSHLIGSFVSVYQSLGHVVSMMTIGLPMPHVSDSKRERLYWHFLSLALSNTSADWPLVNVIVDRYHKRMAVLLAAMIRNERNVFVPLPPLHSHCHFDRRAQLLCYDGQSSRTLKGTKLQLAKRAAPAPSGSVRAQSADVQDVVSLKSSTRAPLRRASLVESSAVNRILFAV